MAASQTDALNGVKTLAIDAFDTLFPTNPKGFDLPGCMFRVFERRGIPYDPSTAWRLYRTLEHVLYRGGIANNRVFWRLVLGHLDIEATPNLISDLISAEVAHYQFPGLALHDGVREFLEFARSADFTTVLWSNATWTGWKTEIDLHLPDLFSGWSISCLERHVKEPFPGEKSLLNSTVQSFKISNPGLELLVVDDQLKYLRASYREFGCRTALVLNGRPLDSGTFRTTLIVDRLADLEQYLPDCPK